MTDRSTSSVPASQSGSTAPAPEIPGFNRILVAINFTELCARALCHAQGLLPAGGTIRLLHICGEPTRGINPLVASSVYFDHCLESAAEKSDADDKLKAMAASIPGDAGIAITTEVRARGDVAEAICEAAEQFGADVVCMATKGHSRTGVALLGSTVQSVLCRIHIPVFIITPPAVAKQDELPAGEWTPHAMPL